MHLTNQEYKIARLLGQRLSRQAIESKLAITETTLRVHLSNLCKKLNIPSPNAHRINQLLMEYNHERKPRANKPLTLAPSEREVIGYRIAGKTFWQIAKIRGCAVSTVLCIGSTACRKLHIRKSTNPVTLARALATFDAQPRIPTPSAPAPVSTDPADY